MKKEGIVTVSIAYDPPLDAAALSRENATLILRQQNGRCFYCAHLFRRENPADLDTWDGYRGVIFDHLIPRRVGGSHGPENRVAACPQCDGAKGGRLPTLEEMHKKGEIFLRGIEAQKIREEAQAEAEKRLVGRVGIIESLSTEDLARIFAHENSDENTISCGIAPSLIEVDRRILFQLRRRVSSNLIAMAKAWSRNPPKDNTGESGLRRAIAITLSTLRAPVYVEQDVDE